MGDPRHDSRERLRHAAVELFAQDGYHATTNAAIARRAGVTERTLYRLFGDKREILFDDEERLQRLLVDVVETSFLPPGQTLRAALTTLAGDICSRRDHVVQRALIVRAHSELAERELWKGQVWSHAVAEALVARGVDSFDAAVHSELALGLFRAAFATWIDSRTTDLVSLIEKAYDSALSSVVASG